MNEDFGAHKGFARLWRFEYIVNLRQLPTLEAYVALP